MPDTTIIVDDTDSRIVYGGEEHPWSVIHDDQAYQGTAHVAQFTSANLSLDFFGSREISVHGTFIGDNNASDSARYPVFYVGTTNLNCTPNPPKNGGQFLCYSELFLDNASHSLAMFSPPDLPSQQYRIDFIRHGSTSKSPFLRNTTVVHISSPDNHTSGFTFLGDWEAQDLGPANYVGSALRTSTASSQAIYTFSGSSIAWFGCCMPPGTSTNTATGTYAIDGSMPILFNIDSSFVQDVTCKDEKILFQDSTLAPGNHTLQVVYNGDASKMPLSLCALAATPTDFKGLDIISSSADSSGPSSSTILATPPALPGPSDTTASSKHFGTSNKDTRVIIGVVVAVVIVAGICLALVVYIVRLKHKAAQLKRGQNSKATVNPFLEPSNRPHMSLAKNLAIFGSRRQSTASDTEVINIPTSNRNSQESEPISLELRPPSYRTRMPMEQNSRSVRKPI